MTIKFYSLSLPATFGYLILVFYDQMTKHEFLLARFGAFFGLTAAFSFEFLMI